MERSVDLGRGDPRRKLQLPWPALQGGAGRAARPGPCSARARRRSAGRHGPRRRPPESHFAGSARPPKTISRRELTAHDAHEIESRNRICMLGVLHPLPGRRGIPSAPVRSLDRARNGLGPSDPQGRVTGAAKRLPGDRAEPATVRSAHTCEAFLWTSREKGRSIGRKRGGGPRGSVGSFGRERDDGRSAAPTRATSPPALL